MSELIFMAKKLNLLLIAYTEIDKALFGFSWRKIIPIPYVFKEINYEIYASELQSIIDEINGIEILLRDFLSETEEVEAVEAVITFLNYVILLSNAVHILKEIAIELHRKSIGTKSLSYKEYKYRLVQYDKAVKEYLEQADDMNRLFGGSSVSRMNIFTSIKKAITVNKIAKEIAKPTLTLQDLLKGEGDKARQKLYDLVEKYDSLKSILNKYSAAREDLNEIYWRLMATGAGQWVKGDFVAVSALVYPQTLDYVLRKYRQEDIDWSEVSFQLIMYFSEGKVGNL